MRSHLFQPLQPQRQLRPAFSMVQLMDLIYNNVPDVSKRPADVLGWQYTLQRFRSCNEQHRRLPALPAPFALQRVAVPHRYAYTYCVAQALDPLYHVPVERSQWCYVKSHNPVAFS